MDEKPPVMLKRTRSNGSGNGAGSSAAPGPAAEPAAKSARGAPSQAHAHQGTMTYEHGGGSSAPGAGPGAAAAAAGAGPVPPVNIEDIAAASAAPNFFTSAPKVRSPEFRTLRGARTGNVHGGAVTPLLSFETISNDPRACAWPGLPIGPVASYAMAQTRTDKRYCRHTPAPTAAPPPLSPPPSEALPRPRPLFSCSRDDQTFAQDLLARLALADRTSNARRLYSPPCH